MTDAANDSVLELNAENEEEDCLDLSSVPSDDLFYELITRDEMPHLDYFEDLYDSLTHGRTNKALELARVIAEKVTGRIVA